MDQRVFYHVVQSSNPRNHMKKNRSNTVYLCAKHTRPGEFLTRVQNNQARFNERVPQLTLKLRHMHRGGSLTVALGDAL